MDVVQLAVAQLEAYNAADLDAFCKCYHPDVVVYDGEEVSLRGLVDFRERYAAMFARGGFGGTVPGRVTMGRHCVELEHWWKLDPETGERSTGEVLVRYTEREGRIGIVQFLRP